MTDVSPVVHLDVDDAVATVTLDSPANRNALSQQLVGELRNCLNAAAADSSVRVVVLTHTGTTFSSGADLADAATGGLERGTRALLDLLRVVVELPLPVCAVIRGHARAGGVGLVGACDVALATESSTFAFTEVRLGLAPAIISLTTLSRLTPRDAARKYLTGAVFGGVEAARSGLVNAAVPEERMDAELEDLLGPLRGVPRQGLTETKRLLTADLLQAFDDAGNDLVHRSARLFASPVAQEAIAAFRRRPSRQ